VRLDVTIPYRPRPLQRQIHDRLKRFNVLVCHRRFGKTVLAINHTIRAALTCPLPDPRYAYVAPTYKQAKLIAWDYVKQFTDPIPGRIWNEQELRCDLPNGAKVRLLGADNPDSLRGIYLDGVVPDEPALMPPTLWPQVIRPLLEDRMGWALFIGTPKGHNQFHDLHRKALSDPDWFTAVYRASETGVFTQEQLAALRRDMSEEEYEQEFECSFEAAIVGAYFGKEMAEAERDGRITDVPYDPAMPVNTYWDLGAHDNMAIWFVQQEPTNRRVIRAVCGGASGLPGYAKMLREFGYTYGEHWGPHDLAISDIGTGKTRLETARQLGIDFKIAPKLAPEDGRNAARLMIPKCYFDRKNCERGVEALKLHRREWNERMGVFRAEPLKDWTSHYADAFRYFGVADKPVRSGKVDYRDLYR
jgi:phage terminase large subunit